MPRPVNPDLTRRLSLSLPATTLGKVGTVLLDPVHQKPIYGAQSKLTNILYEMWLDHIQGHPVRDMPSLEEIRNV